jgi:hypothetical protein
MLELGPTKGRILSHRTKMLGDKIAVSIQCETPSGEKCEALIFLTEKAMNMARRSLKVCGFDVDAHLLEEIDTNPTLLAGNLVPLMVDEWNGKIQVKIDLDSRADKGALMSATSKLRAAKKRASDLGDEPPPLTDDEIPF